MLRSVSLLLILALLLSAVPALAEDAPPLWQQAAPPPADAFRPLPSHGPKSRDAMTGGIILVASGVTALVLGTQLALAAEGSCRNDFFLPSGTPADITRDCTDKAAEIAAVSTLVAGTLLLGGGIGLWIYGAEEVPVLRRARASAARPALVVGPRGAAIRFAF